MLMGQMHEAGVVDELFLTLSPILAGGGEHPRPTLAAGVDLLPIGARGRLLGVHGHGSYLFPPVRAAPKSFAGAFV
jgi:hypothetical protein